MNSNLLSSENKNGNGTTHTLTDEERLQQRRERFQNNSLSIDTTKVIY